MHESSLTEPNSNIPTSVSQPKLTVELVPRTCWYSNVRDHVSKEQWDSLRKPTYKKANSNCEICGGRGAKHPVECHEIWHYDDESKSQKLLGLIALCPDCHQVKHIGLAGINGKAQEASEHLAKINGWTSDQVKVYLAEVWKIWGRRSQHQWKLDLSWLEQECGIKVEERR